MTLHELTADKLERDPALLRDCSETTERLREFAAFAGVLTAAERAPSIRPCAYSHSTT